LTNPPERTVPRRIHGHYRIEANGRMTPMADTQPLASSFTPELAGLLFQRARKPTRITPTLVECLVVLALIAIVSAMLAIGIAHLSQRNAMLKAEQAAHRSENSQARK